MKVSSVCAHSKDIILNILFCAFELYTNIDCVSAFIPIVCSIRLDDTDSLAWPIPVCISWVPFYSHANSLSKIFFWLGKEKTWTLFLKYKLVSMCFLGQHKMSYPKVDSD